MKIIFVGDIALGDHPKAVGFGFYSKYREGIPDILLSRILPNDIHGDIIFGNLEYNLSEETVKGVLVSDVYCKGIIKYIDFIKLAGFTVLNVANNHQYQHGRESFISTVNNIRESGIHVCGTENDFSPGSILKIGEIKVAFLGWSYRPRQDFTDDPLYNEFIEEKSYQQIQSMREYADVICVSIHWGEEFIGIPNEKEKQIARKMIDCGATLVIGHHPHVIREIEQYKNGTIAYSLGNFICDMIWNKSTIESGCLLVELTGSAIDKVKFYPAIIGSDYFPHYLTLEESDRFLNIKRMEYRKLYKLNKTISYDCLRKREMIRHQVLTLLYIIKNICRYKGKYLYEIFINAIWQRLNIRK